MTAESTEKATSEETTIVINLNDDRDAYIVKDPKDIIHVNELEQVRVLIEQSVKDANGYVDAKAPFRRKHDTIMLAGVRGSGKTTFMLSLLNFIKNDISGTSAITFSFVDKNSIEVLNIFDPTLIEDKVHVFVNIISLIKDRVYEKAKKCNGFTDFDSSDGIGFREWEEIFKKLADGLPAINGVGKDGFSGDEWLDSEFVMSKGLGRAHAANNLEKNFHDFVRQSLKYIGKTAFLLCFDDIDTNFSKGWPVLEVLHKYLTTPQFITVLSGDPHLYSTLIRDQQWRNFSVRQLRMECRTRDERHGFKETVAHLEEQYFLKLLKAERRVFLTSLYRKGQQIKEENIHVSGRNKLRVVDKNTPLVLRDIYRDIMKEFGVYSGVQQETSYRFLASTPLRTQKQLLALYDDSSAKKDYEFSNPLIDIFWSALATKGIDVSNLRNVPHYTVPQIIEYLVRNNLLIEGYTLIPNYSDHFTNSAQFALSTIITDRIRKDPSQVFEFWIRVCLTRELGALFEDNQPEKQSGPSINDYVASCAVTNLRTSRYVSRYSTAYIRAYLGYQAGLKSSEMRTSYASNSWHGTLPLYGLANKKKLTDRIDYVLEKENKNYFLKVMGYLPLSGATNHRGESLPIYSIYNLLGVLGEIVLAARSAKDEDAVREVRRTIVKNSQFREYPLPSWAQAALSSGDDQTFGNVDEDNTTDEEIGRVSKEFASAMVKWASNVEPGFVVSSSIMAKAFTRFFYSSNSMDKELSQNKDLGYWMHRMVIVFLNSVLVVEAMETLNLTNARLDLRNPVEKDDIFIGNLKKINEYEGENKKRLKLSKWILSCPIWKIYMNNSFDFSARFSDPENNFDKFTSEQGCKDENKEWRGLYALLEKVHIRVTDSAVNAQKNRKAVRKKKESSLPGFSVNDDKCMAVLANTLKIKKYEPLYITDCKPEELRDLLRKELNDRYNSNSINIATSKSIIDRIYNEKFTW